MKIGKLYILTGDHTAANKGMEVDWEKWATFSLLRRLSKSNLFYSFGHNMKKIHRYALGVA